jgi:hypothetical protein
MVTNLVIRDISRQPLDRLTEVLQSTSNPAFTDLFSDGQSGAAIRAFLGLPDSISAGANFIADSRLPIDHKVENSIVIGTTITGKRSSTQGAIVLGSNIGRIIANHGACVIWCRVDDLRVDGPNGIAFRLDGPHHVVLGDESATTLRLGERILNLKYSHRIGNIDRYIFEKRLPGNPVSFSEAASLIKAMDPIELHRSWMARLSGGRPGRCAGDPGHLATGSAARAGQLDLRTRTGPARRGGGSRRGNRLWNRAPALRKRRSR